MKGIVTALVLGLVLMTVACAPVERQAYRAIVASKAFLDAEKAQHAECPAAGGAVCEALTRATSAKDVLIDAAEVYCSGPQFETGGACQAPAKGTPASEQAIAKLKAAIAVHDQAVTDLKKITGGK